MAFKADHKETFRLLKQDLMLAKDDAIPAGFRTVMQWSEEVEMSRAHTAKILGEALKAGRAECRKFRLRGHQTPHYRLIDAKVRK